MKTKPKTMLLTIRQAAHLLQIFASQSPDSEFFKTESGKEIYIIRENFVKSVSDGYHKIKLPLNKNSEKELTTFIQNAIDDIGSTDTAFVKKLRILKTKITNELTKSKV